MDANIYYYINSEPLSYISVLELQKKLREDVLSEKRGLGIILFLVHKPVFTLGIRGDINNILLSEDEIAKRNIDVVKIKRGGDVTYHGPGQLVIYPIINIKNSGFFSIKEFVSWWNKGISDVLKEKYQINAKWREDKPGLWINNKKIMAVGLHFRKFVPIHGFALNINPNMEHFSGIIPCGLKNSGVTSIKAESGKEPSIQELAKEILGFVGKNLNNITLKEDKNLI
jgi:lipoyl(octanoyl) transferase